MAEAEVKASQPNTPIVEWDDAHMQSSHANVVNATSWGHRAASSAAHWGTMAAKAHSAGLIWMAPVAPQDVRPKNSVYWEASNSEMFRKQWEGAINGGADWVQLITWNDYSEHSSVTPSTSSNYAFHDLTAYYTAWFKTGQRPVIRRDAFYTFHRTHASGAAPNPSLQSRRMNPSSSSDAPLNEVEMLAFLTSPATLEIELAGKTHRRQADKGVTSFKVPLAPGTPLFRIVRDGQVVTSIRGEDIRNTIAVQDMLYHGDSSLRVNGPTPTVPVTDEPALPTYDEPVIPSCRVSID